jgi:hypothetical protein
VRLSIKLDGDPSRVAEFLRKQLLEEGAVQAFTDSSAARREWLLAAVGELQFDVVRFRLENEYDTATDIEWLPFRLARWTDHDPVRMRSLRLPYSAKLVHDQIGHPAVLFQSQWDAEYAERENPRIGFSADRISTTPRPAEHCQPVSPQPVSPQPVSTPAVSTRAVSLPESLSPNTSRPGQCVIWLNRQA